MNSYILFICILTCHLFATAQDFKIGHVQRTFIDSTRNNRQISCEIYYPATVDGDNAPIASGTFPTLVFGHGFVMPYSAYDIYWNAIVPKGYVMLFPTTESSLSPSHVNFGKDIAFLTQVMKQQHRIPTSLFFNAIDSTCAVMGHSMGGGSAFLAMQQDPSITALISLAGAVTNPSSVTAARSIIRPSLVIAGANDCVAPPKNHQIPMYDSLAANCKTYLSIIGADHCQFASYNFNCSFGQSTCTPKATINAAMQQSIVMKYLLPWLNYQLKKDCKEGARFSSLLATATDVLGQKTCSLESPKPIIQGSTNICFNNQPHMYFTQTIPGEITQWEKPRRGIILGSSITDSLQVVWKEVGTDTLRLRKIRVDQGCYTDTAIIVRVMESPQSIIQGTNQVCIGSSELYSTSSFPNTTYEWMEITKGKIVGEKTSHTIAVSWTNEGIDTLKLRLINTITGCSKDTQIIVRILASPIGEIFGDDTVCPGSISSYSMQLSVPSTVEWFTPKCGIIKGNAKEQSVQIQWLNSGIDTIFARIKEMETSCTKDTMLIVRVTESPDAFIYGTKSVCEESVEQMYYSQGMSNHSYTWNIMKGGIFIGQNNKDSVKVRWIEPGKQSLSLRVKNISTGCTKDTNVSIIVNPRPKPIINGKDRINETDKGILYSVPFNVGSMYAWTILSGEANITDMQQYQIVLDPLKSGTIVLEAFESNSFDCAGADTFTISVRSATRVNDESQHTIIYPNPTSGADVLTIQSMDQSSIISSIEISSILGKQIQKVESLHQSIFDFPITHLPSGYYVIKVTIGNHNTWHALIIQ
ncbi:MAG: hypothetical protein RL734_283 [Bacteroidota bacterium]|jgi:hypothetical protein